MTWLLAYAIGALTWLALMLFAAQVCGDDQARRRRIAILALRDTPLWPLAAIRMAVYLIAAFREVTAQHRNRP